MILNSGMHTVALSPLGGQILDWRFSGYHIFFPQQMVRVEKGVKKLRGGMPVMFPNFGNDHFGILPKHGFLRHTYADPKLNLSRSSRAHNFTFASRHENFPWKYDLWLNYQMMEKGPAIRLLASSRGTFRGHESAGYMPVNFGIHPYFYTPQSRAYVRVDGEEVHFVLGEVTSGDKSSLIIPSGREVEIELWGLGIVKMLLSDAFVGEQAKLVIWRDNPHYLCVEPISTDPDLFGNGGHYVKPGRSEMASCEFSFSPKRY